MRFFAHLRQLLAVPSSQHPLSREAELIRLQAVIADTQTIRALALAIANRSGVPFGDALLAVANVGMGGGPDLRTPKGWACASAILGVPGQPIIPTIH